MPVVGHDSSTARSLGPGAYAPTEDAYTSAGTPALATASNTRCEPSTFVAWVAASSREGWISHARCTTQSAPRIKRTRSVLGSAMFAVRHVTFGYCPLGARRATPVTSCTRSSRARASSTLVPAFPLAPMTTTRMSRRYPSP
jgi:hypothetical protein